ncbi:ROK family protein [Gymnodinialimonas sp. 2305UL16-5]|uniref:ROK family protein n=1 Tax=Gymnodinialimonas mytili TaxID=3126503 RepID=UPI0030B74787
MTLGGIDLGGTKIEARLFDAAGAETLAVHRIPTPTDSFASLLSALSQVVTWLEAEGGGPMPIGLSIAGMIDPDSGVSFAANLPSSGYAIAHELEIATGRHISVLNDCMAFTYSEANGGAGEGARNAVGLIIGTGVGAGLCVDCQLPYRHGGLAVEIGHLGLTAATLARHDLPVLRCGCGQEGCVETYVAGPGLSHLAQLRLGRALTPQELSADQSAEAQAVLEIWADLAADALYAIQITLAPDRIILGGGLSNLPDCADRLTSSLARRGLSDAPRPQIVTARFGDTSGARGAALVAKEHMRVRA